MYILYILRVYLLMSIFQRLNNDKHSLQKIVHSTTKIQVALMLNNSFHYNLILKYMLSLMHTVLYRMSQGSLQKLDWNRKKNKAPGIGFLKGDYLQLAKNSEAQWVWRKWKFFQTCLPTWMVSIKTVLIGIHVLFYNCFSKTCYSFK